MNSLHSSKVHLSFSFLFVVFDSSDIVLFWIMYQNMQGLVCLSILVTPTEIHVQVIFCIANMQCSNTIFSNTGMVRQEIQEETDRITGRTKMISPVPIHLSIYSPNGTPFICYICCVYINILFIVCYNSHKISIMHNICLP